DPSVTVANLESDTLIDLTVTLNNRPDGAAEVLAVSTSGTAIQASYATGVLTLSGTDTLAHYQKVLATATYVNTATQPNTADRTLSVVANDGTRASAPAIVTVHLGAVPVLDL